MQERWGKTPIIIVGSVVATLLLVGAGAGGYWYWQAQQADEEASVSRGGPTVIPLAGTEQTDTETEIKDEKSAANTLVSLVKPQLLGKEKQPSVSGPFGKVGENNFFVRNDTYYGAAVEGTSEQAAQTLALIKKQLMLDKYKETIRQKGSTTQSYEALFVNDTVLCLVYDIKPTRNDGKTEVGMLCADAEQFKETANIYEPYVTAYKDASKLDVANRGFYDLKTAESPVPGYRRASLRITGENQDTQSGYLGVFYQTPDGVWKYFTSSQGMVACSKYQGTELQNAFKDEPCEKAGEVSKVGS